MIDRFQEFRKKPFAGILATVGFDKCFTSLTAQLVDAICLRLSGVMFPEFNPRVWILFPSSVETKRRAIGLDRQHGAGSKIGAQADYLLRQNLCRAKEFRDRDRQDREIVGGVLQR